jgi:ATP/ADP translocase
MTARSESRRRVLRANVLAPATVLFAVMIAHALLETARDALFLIRLGPQLLAVAYLVIAATALVAVTAVRRWGGVSDPRRMLVGFLVAATAGTATLAATISHAPQLVFVLYVWTGLVATLVVPCFWTVMDRSMRLAQAKRAFAAIGAGGVLGALAGSAIATLLARVVETHHLVTAGALVLALATIAAVALAPRAAGEPADLEPEVALEQVPRSRRLIRWLLVLGVVSTLALTIGDLTFKRVLAEEIAPDQLALAFGAIYTALNVLGLIVQLAIAPRLLAGLGVGATLTVLPVLLVATSLGFAASGALLAIVALKLGDGALRYSAHRVGSEILFLPVPTAVRDGSKPIVDAIGQRGGQALAAVVVFAAASVASPRAFAAMTAVAGLLWLLALSWTRRAYVDRFRDMLRSGEPQRGARVPDLDRESVQLLTESLANPDEVEALAALDLLARCRGTIPALVLYHPRHRVVRQALSVLDAAGRPELRPVFEHLLEHADPEIRAITLLASRRAGGDRARLERALSDPHPTVRAAALVALSSDADRDGHAAGIAGMAAGSPVEQLALVRAIGYAPHDRFRPVLRDLLACREPAVVRGVLHVLERAPELVELDDLLRALADPHVRGDVRRVLLAIGDPALDRAIAALDDPRTPLAVRQHLPRTISRFGTRGAAAALVAQLGREADATTELKLLRALGRMRTEDPALPIDAAAVRAYARRAVADAARFATLCDLIDEADEATPASRLLRELLVEKRQLAIERVFRALGILHPRGSLRSVHDAITSADEARRAAAREILDDLVPIELRAPLLAVIADLPPALRRARLGSLAPGPFANHEAVLAALLAERSESLRCVAAHHVAERRLVALRADLERLRPIAGSSLVMRAFDQAIERLDA